MGFVVYMCSVTGHYCHRCISRDHMRHSRLYRLLLPQSVGEQTVLVDVNMWKTDNANFSRFSTYSVCVHVLLYAATSVMRWRNWTCQTASLQTSTCLTVGVLDTTINQLTTTYSQVVYQSPLDHSIISGSSSINSCWCRLATTLSSLQRAAILLDLLLMNRQIESRLNRNVEL